MSLIEAQAAGLPCFISENISDTGVIAKPLVTQLSLAAGPAVWAEAILATRETNKTANPNGSLNLIKQSIFNIDNNIKRLTTLYGSP